MSETEVNTDDAMDTGVVDWPRDTQKRAVLLWISFLCSAVMSVVFFAFIDPLVVVDALPVGDLDSRELGYSTMFFFFWVGTSVCGWLCLRLTRRKRQQPRPVSGKQRPA